MNFTRLASCTWQMDEDEQRILEHIQRTYPAEFVEKGMQVLKEIVLKRMRSQIELDARLDRMQAAAQREGVVLDRWERIMKEKCLAIIESSWAIREEGGPLPAPPRQAVEHEDEDASLGVGIAIAATPTKAATAAPAKTAAIGTVDPGKQGSKRKLALDEIVERPTQGLKSRPVTEEEFAWFHGLPPCQPRRDRQ